MWVLILLSTFPYHDNVSVTPIEGFQSQEACHAAGVRVQDAPPSKNIVFTCVRKG
jgi:hypothetical protein